MGKFDFNFDAEFTRQLERLENYDEIAPEILNSVAPILEKKVRDETAKHKDTGDMLKSIRTTKASKNKYGYFVMVRPTGKDRKGNRNMEKMAHLEYGTSKITPKPIMTKAINDARQVVNEAMQEEFKKVVGVK